MNGAAALRILAETAYPESVASARVRIARFAPHLRNHGVELQYVPNLTDGDYAVFAEPRAFARKAAALAKSTARVALRRPAQDALLLVHRLRLLNPAPGLDPPRALDVYDLDDALFLGSVGAVNERFGWAKQESRRAIECLRRARLVIAGNSYLADNAVRYAGRVEIVPTCVDPSQQPLHTHGDHDPVTVGWIGSRTTSKYLTPLFSVLARLNADRPRARLVLVGAAPGFQAPWIERRPWTLDGEARDLASFDIGVMPLPDTDWARGKCGYKVLQYFAAGVPAIASPVGVTRELVGAERGLLAETDAEWTRALDELLADSEARRERGFAARRYVEDNYSYSRWSVELASMFRSLTA